MISRYWKYTWIMNGSLYTNDLPAIKIYVTHDQHMHPDHQRMKHIKGFKKEELLQMAAGIGKSTRLVVSVLLDGGFFIEQNYKACYGLLILKNKYTPQRLEAACQRVLTGPRVTYIMVKIILSAGFAFVERISANSLTNDAVSKINAQSSFSGFWPSRPQKKRGLLCQSRGD